MNSSQEFATRRCIKDITFKQICKSCGGTTEDGIGAIHVDMYIYMHVCAQYKKQSMSSTAGIPDKFPVTSKGKQSLGTPHERKTMRDDLKGIHI